MLKQRIVDTLKFFDLQDLPLTLLELAEFLMADTEELKQQLDSRFEYIENSAHPAHNQIFLGEITRCLEGECMGEVGEFKGFYFLAGREHLVQIRLNNYLFGRFREKRILRLIGGARHLPFVRGIALLGSQALGQQKENSDIDLFIITEPHFLGLGRLMVTAYMQLLGVRRHGTKISNRFCLNHYLAGPRSLNRDRNLYTAAEYIKLRPLVYSNTFVKFRKHNNWVYSFFPNAKHFEPKEAEEQQSAIQKLLEKLLTNSFGQWLEQKLKAAQLGRIQKGEFIVAEALEMSFHPNNRKAKLFSAFFEHQKEH